jgi:hypothetical protein
LTWAPPGGNHGEPPGQGERPSSERPASPPFPPTPVELMSRFPPPRSRSLLSLLPIPVLLLGACGEADDPVPHTADPEAVAPAPDEGIELQVGMDRARYGPGDTILVVVRLVNRLDGTRRLDFSTAQRYDLEVLTPEGESVYRWAADRAFAQALSHEELTPGQDGPEWEERLPAPDREGEYRLKVTVPAEGTTLGTELPLVVTDEGNLSG